MKMVPPNKDNKTGTSFGQEKSQPTVSAFGNSSTGFSNGFGGPANTVFGNFSNQNNQQQHQGFGQWSCGTFRSQQPYPANRKMPSQHTTNICFTGFGQPKAQYRFGQNDCGRISRKITLTFENNDSTFGSSLFGNQDTIIEIEGMIPTTNYILPSNTDISFTVLQLEKFNSIYALKSAEPLRYLIKVKQPYNSNTSFYRNKKITLTFQSNETNDQKQSETIVEVPLNFQQTFPMPSVSMNEYMFAVGPNSASNSFEVQTSKNEVFNIRFREINNTSVFGNRQTRTGSIYFDQGRQLNGFPFSNPTSAYSTHFGHSAKNNQPTLFGSSAPSSSSFGKPMTSQGFGSCAAPTGDQSFGRCQTTADNNQTTLFGSPAVSSSSGLFSTTSCGEQLIGHGEFPANTGESVFGHQSPQQSCASGDAATSFGQSITHYQSGELEQSVFGQATAMVAAPSSLFGQENNFLNAQNSPQNNGYTFGAKQPFEIEPTIKYQPTLGNDNMPNNACINTKTNCITAMKEYEHNSLEELRYEEYLRSHCQPPPPLPPKPHQSQFQPHYMMTHGPNRPSNNTNYSTNEAFFEILHKLIPYLNAGSFCKCYRSSRAAKNSSALTNGQSSSKADSHDQLFGNTQKPRHNDNMSINEFYEDVFKYLDHIQNQYHHLETTLNNKNETNTNKDQDQPKDSHSTSPKDEKEPSPPIQPQSPTKQNSPAKPAAPIFGSSTLAPIKLDDKAIADPLKGIKIHALPPTIAKNSEIENKLLPSTGAIKKTTANSTTPKQDSSSFSVPNFSFILKPSSNISNTEETSKKDANQKNVLRMVKKPNKNPHKSPVAIFGSKTGDHISFSTTKTDRLLLFPPSSTTAKTTSPNEAQAKKCESFFGTAFVQKNTSTNSPHLATFVNSKNAATTTPVDDKATSTISDGDKTPENLYEKTTGIFLSDRPLMKKAKTDVHKLSWNLNFANAKTSKTEATTTAVNVPEKSIKTNDIFAVANLFQTQNISGPIRSGLFGMGDSANKNDATKKIETDLSDSFNVQNMNKSLDVQDGFVNAKTSKALDMKKISFELAALEATELSTDRNRRNSVAKSETGSEASNSSYCLIENEEDRVNNSSIIGTEVHPTGIKMTRYGYYTEPSLDQLKTLIAEDGSCVVPNFTIGRRGYGTIHFDSEINVAGLNIDELVHFRNKEIIIFPTDSTEDPTIIENLIRKSNALVTLKQVWPIDKVLQKPIKDPEILESIKYEDKLRVACQKNNIHFVEYRPETGSWLFKIKDFSKRSINCWNEEDEELTEEYQNMKGIAEIMLVKEAEIDGQQASPSKKLFNQFVNFN